MSLRESFKSRLSNLSQNLSQSSVLTAAKQKVSSVSNFVEQVVASEPQQFIEAQELGIYYITDRVLAMGYPSNDTIFTGSRIENAMQKSNIASKLGTLISDSLCHKVSKFLNKYHNERYMIWNLSERSYDTSIFNDNVIEFKFPGYPAPPLEQLFQLLTGIDGWLGANDSNVAVLHCQTGKGRTVTCVSAYLAWCNYNNFTPAKALLYVCKMMGTHVKDCTIPSQTRYLAYLTKILIHKQTPLPNPLMIERIIIHGIPIFEQRRVKKSESKAVESESKEGKESKESKEWMQSEKDKSDKNDDNDGSNGMSNGMSNGIGKNEEEEEDNVELGDNISQSPNKGDSIDSSKANDNVEKSDKSDENVKMENNGNNGNNEKSDKNDSNDSSDKNENNDSGKNKNENQKIEKKERKSREKCYEIVSGLRPYIQIFKNAKLIFSSRKKGKQVRFYQESDQNIKFIFGKEIQGDILVRIRHLSFDNKSRVSVCRFAFHTGYLEKQGVIRFKKSQLDGAWNNSRFPKDFWIDMLCGQTSDIESTQSQLNHQFWLDISKRSNEMTIKHQKQEIEQRKRQIKQAQNKSNSNSKSKSQSKTKTNTKRKEKENKSKEKEKEKEKGSKNDKSNENEKFDIGFIDDDSETSDSCDVSTTNDENDSISVEKVIITKTKINKENENEMDNKTERKKQEMDLLDMMASTGNEKNESKEKEIENDSKTNQEKNDNNVENEATTGMDSMVDNLDDLEQFADGLDLDNVEVDSETEQNFDALLQQLDDDTTNHVSSPVVDELP